MKFNELTDERIQEAREIYLNKDMSWDERMKMLVNLFGKSERTVRKWCSEKLGFKEKQEVEPEQYIKAKAKQHSDEKKRFIISWAQNNTPVHKKLLRNMEAYAEFIDAEILVIAGRYKNPTSIWTNNNKNEEHWKKEVEPRTKRSLTYKGGRSEEEIKNRLEKQRNISKDEPKKDYEPRKFDKDYSKWDGDEEDYEPRKFDKDYSKWDGDVEEIDLSKYADLGETEDDIQELDLDEIKNEINRSVGETLSKYFK
jgi:hypothetical protein